MSPVSFYGDMDILFYVVVGWLAYRVFRKLAFARTSTSTPPGPPGLPFVGNAYQIPQDRQWLKFDEWIKQYGRLLPLNHARDGMLIELSSFQVRSCISRSWASPPLSSARRRLRASCWMEEVGVLPECSRLTIVTRCRRGHLLRQTSVCHGRRTVSHP